MKYLGITLLSLLGMFVIFWVLWAIGIGMGIITLPAHTLTNKVQMNHDIIDQTVNAQNCLQWQDWFRTQEGTITTLQQTVDNAQQALDQFNQSHTGTLTDTQSQQQMILSQNVTGAKNEANDAINAYDAKAKQENLAYCKNGLPVYVHPF